MSFSEALTQELNNGLQQKVATGDECARTQMIEGNMRLAAYKVEQFLAELPQYGYLKDDLLSEAFVGLTEAVNQIRDKGAGDNPTALISVCIDKQLRTAVASAPMIRKPRRTKGSAPNVRNVDAESLAYDPAEESDVRESIDACCESDTEREIVALREAGYDDTAIAERTGLSRWKVGRVRRRLEENYENA